MHKRDDVWAVVTTFEPDRTLLDVIARLTSQTGGVVVVDDGSAGADAVLEEVGRVTDAVLVRQPANAGIGAALNAGIERALAEGAEAVVTFDQDSFVAVDYVDRLAAGADEAAVRGVDAWLAVPEFFADVRQADAELPSGVLTARSVIQSGMLIPRWAWERLGTFRDDYFIDMVDTEYELRAKSRGGTVIAVRGLRLDHELGRQYRRSVRGRPVRVPGLPDVVTLSTPYRYYYRARNRVRITREYLRRFPKTMALGAIVDLAHFADAIAAADDRRGLARTVCSGIAAGFRRVGGKIPAPLVDRVRQTGWRYPEVARTRVEQPDDES